MKKGKWIKKNNPNYSPFDGTSPDNYICSNCGAIAGKPYKYCHCGSKNTEVI